MARLVHNIQKKQHRERAQPLERQRLGLLEKKKDYRLRAQDYHKKQKVISALKEKARNRNPDEYYHAMTKLRTDDKGRLVKERPESVLGRNLTAEQIQLLKTQDLNYIRTKLNEEKAKLLKFTDQGSFLKSEGSHIVFVESEKEMNEFKPENFFHTDAALLARKENRLTLEQLEDEDLESLTPKDLQAKEKYEAKKLKILEATIERIKQLEKVEEELRIRQELAKKGSAKKTVDSDGKPTFKWKNVRKR